VRENRVELPGLQDSSLLNFGYNQIDASRNQRRVHMTQNMDNQENRNGRGVKLGTGIVIGIGVGVALGVALDSIPLGIAIGIGIGVIFGISFDQKDREEDK
jgi:F0F1-type ATP synthase assembly protein I